MRELEGTEDWLWTETPWRSTERSSERSSERKMTLPGASVDPSGQSGELVSWKYLEAVCAVGVDRATQCGRARWRRTRELNQLRCPFRLAILEAHNEDFTPEPVDTLTPLARGLVDHEL